MVTRQDIVAEARSWVGTPWHHAAHAKGLAVDCAGLLRGVAMNVGACLEMLRDMASGVTYTRHPDGSLLGLMDQYFDPISRAQMEPGDVVVVRLDRMPQHMGIVGDYRHGGHSIIHACNMPSVQPARVVEHRLMFHTRFVFVAAYRFRNG